MNKPAIIAASALAAAAFLPTLASAQTVSLAAQCAGTASATGITWSATTSGGIAPIALLWGNGATTSPITVAEAPGVYTMTLQATDASSTVATTSCQATVASSTTSSGSGGSILAQIQALIAQINALKAQILQLATGGTSGTGSTTPMTFGNGCPMPNRNLGLGSRGDDVRELQLFLASTSPDQFSAGNATGFFGPLTLQAVKHLQEMNGIASTSTGFVGPLTRDFFGRHCGELIGEGHLKGKAKSPFDPFMNASTSPGHGKGNMDHGDGHDGSGDNASSTDH